MSPQGARVKLEIEVYAWLMNPVEPFIVVNLLLRGSVGIW